MDKVYKYIIQKTVTDKIDKKDAVQLLELLKQEKDKARRIDIAVVGVAAKTSDSENVDELWKNLCRGFDGIRSIPEDRKEDLDDYLNFKGGTDGLFRYRALAYLRDIDKFDYEYFGLSPREAELMDPHQRLFLETAVSAIEDSGYSREKLKRTKTGIYLGHISGNFGYQNLVYDAQVELGTRTILGNMAALIPSRVSYALDLRGPSVLVDTTCSSSLVAIHLACQALRLKECDQALVGGVKINILPLLDGLKLGIESSTGKTLSFDEASDGTGQGEGVGVVMLKPLQKAIADGDNIRAVIKGSAINQDGQSLNLSAPNPQAQTEVIKAAWEAADVKPETISFVEAHGTGTTLGDPIEIEGLSKAFGDYTKRKQFCALSSIKSNIGHLDEAAGIFGFIKTVLSLENKKLPPSIHFNEPNHKIDWENSPVYVNDHLQDWKNRTKEPRRAGVSSFGLSGTNAHVVLEEANLEKKADSGETKENILKISARDEESLKKLVKDYFDYFSKNKNINLVNASYTANVGRSDYEHRLVIVFSDQKDLVAKLKKITAGDKLEDIKNNDFCFYGFQVKNDNLGRVDSETILRTSVLSKLLDNYRKNKKLNKTELETVCQLYTSGADMDWEVLYADLDKQRIQLPTYHFSKKRCWLKFPKTNEAKINFELAWRTKELEVDPIIRNEVLVFLGEGELSDKLFAEIRKDAGEENLIQVSFGDEFKKLGENEFIIKNVSEDYERLLDELKDRTLYQIVHLASLNSRKESISKLVDLDIAEKRGVESLFHLAKALKTNYWNKILNLVVVSDLVNEVSGKEINLKPENAPLFGLCKGLFIEIVNWHCRVIDIDNEKSLPAVVQEIRNEYKDQKVAYREGVRYIEEFRRGKTDRKEIKIRDNGIYVFSGGTGGISLEIMKFLSKSKKLNFIALHLTDIPKRDEWQAIVDNERIKVEDKKRFEAFLEIERNGSKLFLYQVDVTKEKELEKVIQKIKKEFGTIHGIVHAAGKANPRSFFEKDISEFKDIIEPKIQGTWLLDNLTREFDLDFFSLISSAISCFGGAFNTDYIAANSYLDSYAFLGRKQGRNFTAVNWSFWDGLGMHARQNVNFEKIPLKTIPPRVGVREWLASLGNTRPALSVLGEMNYSGRSVFLMKHWPFSFSAEVMEEIQSNIDEFDRREGREEVVVKDSTSDYAQVEKDVAQTIYDVLGYQEVSVNDNFFDLGGDSLFLTEIFSRLEKTYPRLTNITQIFTYPTVAQLAEFLSQGELEKKVITKTENSRENNDIAIIGIAAKTSWADNYKELWENLKAGRECIREIPESRKNDIDNYLQMVGVEEKYMKYSPLAYLEHVDYFDYEFFKFSPREAKLMDPTQRLFLETAYSALEEAGYGGNKLRGTNTGLYLGYGQSDFDYKSFVSNSKMPTSTALFTGNLNALIPSRVSYLLDLRGPSMVVDTACSSSLVSVHLACQSLLAGDCEQAIAGGIRLNLVPVLDRFKVGIESSDWYTRTFDDSADGTGMGEGVAALLLKPLDKAIADGDDIKAVIKGSAVNQDGQSVGITAPNTRAQTEVLLSAWMNAQIDPADISYIEAHGTATSLGDPIEVEALTNAFRFYTDKKQFCAISAIKPNLGHTLEAAGIFSLIKATLSLQNKKLIPSINFHEPNHRLDWENSAVYVNTKYKDWRTDDKKEHLCGISSFGLSGTNCHVVLGEAPKEKKESEEVTPCVFTLSAKNKKTLEELVDSYLKEFSKNKLNLRDVCYTVQTGRGHYEERLAFVVNSFSELKKKLKEFRQNGKASGVFCDRHQIVSKKKEEKEGQLSEKELVALSRQANSFVKKLSQTKEGEENGLNKVCEFYTQGANIAWEEFYKNKQVQRLSLPTYPFQKIRCWVDQEDQVALENRGGSLEYIHPLVERCLVKSADRDIYSTIFSPAKHFVLSDHIINGSHVLPGTVYLEIAKQLGKLYYGDSNLEIKNLGFVTPVIMETGESKEVQIVVQDMSGFKKFSAFSRLPSVEGGEQQWLQHVEGEIHPLAGEEKKVNWDKIKNDCLEKRVEVDINKNAAGFIEFGKRWQNYHAIGFSDKEALAELELPLECTHDLETYYLHPPMLDMAAAAVSMVTGFKALPFYYESFRLFGPMPRKFYAHFYRIGQYDEVEETASFDFDLIDPHGKVFAEVKNFKLRRTRDFTRVIKRNQGSKRQDFYRVFWEEVETKAEEKKANEKSLVFVSDSKRAKEIISSLEKENKEIIKVSLGEEFKKQSDNTFVIKNELDDYIKLWGELKDEGIKKIIHTFSLSDNYKIGSIKTLEKNQKQGVYSLFYLVKALGENVVKEKLDIVLLTEFSEQILAGDNIRPENSSLSGFGKSIVMEDPNWQCRVIDIDEKTSSDKIIKEINLSYLDYKVAWRDGKRYQEIIKRQEVKADKDKKVLKKKGTYLISGGAGRLGLEVANYFGQKEKINLVLLNRSVVPEEKEWSKLAEIKGANDEKFKKLIKLKEALKKKGSSLEFVQVDITSLSAMKKVIASLEERFESIDGIIHAAGLPGDGFIANKEENIMRDVLAPKTKGTLVLDQVTKHIPLDFFVAFSSTTALHGAPGQSDYTAANAYLDAYCKYRTGQGRETLLVNWSGWRDTGMLSESKLVSKYGTLSNEEALAGLNLALENNLDDVIIGSLAYVSQIFPNQEKSTLRFSSDLKSEFFRAREQNEAFSLDKQLKGISLTFKPEDLEKVLLSVWREVLGVSEIDINDHFFDLGGDSLRIAEMHAILEKLYPGKFSVAELFAYPTISKLVQHVSGDNLSEQTSSLEQNKDINQDIAIIGMAARTSESEDLNSFWENIAAAHDCIREIPAERKRDMDDYLRFRGIDKEYQKYHPAAYLETIDKFDYDFFRISPREAQLMDPNQRLLLETTYHAIEDAGYSGRSLNNTKTGLYVGLFPLGRKYYDLIGEVEPTALSEAMVNNMDPTVASRISYHLNLVGPSMLVNTACSSSLVAIHLACQAIHNGDCDQALVGSVKISLLTTASNPQVGIESSDGHTRTFDNDSDGTGLGEGVATVMLKPLHKAMADGDNIRAVIKGSAINQDGQSVGMTAPNALAQTEVILSAWRDAKVNPNDISYIEAHGTGTNLGDPIEIEALSSAFRKYTDRKQFCAVSSVKSNLGHTLEAAGIFGLVKTVLAMENKKLPPSVNFHEPNEKVNWEEAPVYVNDHLSVWPKENNKPFLSGISSFGLSGTNAHVVLESAPGREESKGLEIKKPRIFILSARNREVLKKLVTNYLKYLGDNSEISLDDLCYTLALGRDHQNVRLAIPVYNLSSLKRRLRVCLDSDLVSNEEREIYIGEFKIVPFGQKINNEGELTEKEARSLGAKVDLLATEYVFGEKKYKELAEQIAKIFVAGAEFDWSKLYKNEKRLRLSLPNYPFAEKRCWLNIPGAEKYFDYYHNTKWLKKEIVGNTNHKENILVFIGQDKQAKEMMKALNDSEKEIIKVKLGEEYKKNSKNSYVITNTKDDYKRLLSDLQDREITKIVHLFSLDNKAELEKVDELEESQQRGIYSVMFLIQALQAIFTLREIDLFLVSRNSDLVSGQEKEIIPSNATMIGFAKGGVLENPNIHSRSIDIDNDFLVDQLSKEINFVCSDYKVAYREGERYIEELDQINLSDYSDNKILEKGVIKEGGVYLITGGTGGIGLEIAKAITNQAKVKLVLLGRTKLPAESEWQEILEAEGPRDQRLLARIKNLQELKVSGSEVLTLQADMFKADELNLELKRAEKKFGQVDGVIHAAGLPGGGFIAHKGEMALRKTLAPKLQGTWLLGEFFREHKLDFFCLFSSAVTLISGVGVSDYTAANSYLDAYAHQIALRGQNLIVINWATWDNVGLSFGEEVDEKKQLFKILPIETALDILFSLLKKNIRRVVVGRLNYESDLIYLGDYLPLNFAPSILQKKGNQFELVEKQIKQVKLKGREGDKYTNMEKDLAMIWSEVLGYDEIDIRDNFFELGGDSLAGIRLISRVNKKLNRNLSFREILEYATLKDLSRYVSDSDEVDYKPVIKKVEPKQYKIK